MPPLSVLYVDDEPALLEIGRRFLEREAEVTVETASSAPDAIRLLSSAHFDAIISDYQMPGMDGIEFLKYVRASGDSIPFILFTGRGREEVVIQALNEGADFYLQKGGDPKSQFAELTNKVRYAVSRRQAEEGLRDRERREADIINFLPDATFAIDTNGIVIAWNRAMEEMTGVPASQMLGKGEYEYAVPIYHERRPILIDLVLHDDPVIAARYPSLKRQGRTLIAEATSPYLFNGRGADIWFTATPLYDTKGRIVGAIESIRDVTERMRAEAGLRKSEIFTKVLLDAVPTPVFYKDRHGKYLGCNRAFTEITGTTPEELVGKTVFDLWPPELARTYHQKDMELIQHPDHQIYEFRILDRDGKIRPVIYAKDVFTDESGRIAGIIGAFLDISDRVRVETALSASEERFRTIFDAAQVGMVLVDPVTHRIQEANKKALDLIGATESEVTGRVCHAFICPAEEGWCPVTDLGQAVESSERILVKHDGSRVPVLKTVILTHIRDQSVLIESFFDITDRKRAEDELRATNEQLAASEEQLHTQFMVLRESEQLIRESESRLKYMLGFYERVRQPEKDIMAYAVEGAGAVTGSPLGYLAFLNNDETELTMYAWSKTAMEECSMREKPIIYPMEKTGLWGEAVRQRRAVITNDYAAPNPRKKGYPDGHPQIVRHMNVPVFDGDHIVIVAGVANRSSDYTENEVRQLTILMQELWQVLKRRRAENALRESEQRYRSLIAVSNTGAWEYHGETDYLWCSPEYFSMLGRDTCQFDLSGNANLKQTWLDLLHPEDRERAGRHFTEYLENGSVGMYENHFRMQHADGHWVWIWSRGQTLRDAEGALTDKTIGTHIDVTESVLAEDALRRSEETYRTLIETTDTGFVILDGGGRVLDANHEYVRLTGHARLEEISGRSVTEWTAEDGRERNTSAVRQCMKDGFIRDFEIDYCDASGAITPIEINATVLQTSEGPRILTLCRDITDRKRAEKALHESEQRYRNVVEDQTEFISRFLPDGTHVFVNEAYCRYFGLERDQLLGHRFKPVIPTEDRDRVRAFFASLTPDHPADIIEHRIIMPDGTVRWQRWSGRAVFDASGAVTEYQSVGRDITEKKEAGDKLKASEAKNRAILHALPDMLFINSRDGTYLECVASDPHLLYLPPETIIGKNIREIFLEKTADSFLELFSVCLATGQVQTAEYELVIQNEPMIFEARIVPLDDDTVMTLVRDRTREKRMENDLRESEKKYRTIFETTGAATIIINKDTTIVLASTAFAELSGYEKDEIVGKRSWTEFVVREDLERMRHYHDNRRTDAALAPRVYEFRFIDRAGTIRYCINHVAVIPGTTLSVASVVDISERKRAEDALKESEKLYRSVIENIQDVYYRSDRDGNLILASPSGAALLGYDSVDEVLGKSIADTIYFDPAERAAFLVDLQKTGSLSNYKIRLKKKDGTLVYASTNSHYYHDKSGAVAGVEGILRDITQLNYAEEALRRSEERYRNVVEHAGEAIVVAKGGDRLVYANPAILKLLKTTSDEILNRPFTDFIHPDDRGLVYDRHQRRMRGEDVPAQYDFRLVDRSGETIWVTISPVRILWDGEPATLNFLIEITERKKAEEALRVNEERFRFLAENMADIVWTLGMDLRTMYVSPSITNVLGFTPEERMRQPLQEMMTPASYRLAAMLFAGELRRDREPDADPDRCIAFDTEFYHADGHIVLMENHAKAIRDADGAVIGVYGTSRDITERKRTEEKEQQETARQRAEAEVISRIALSKDLAQGRVEDLVRDMTETAAQVLLTERVGVWFFDTDGIQLVEADTFTASSKTHTSGSLLTEQEFRNEFDTLKRDKYIDASDALTDPRIAGYVETYLKPNRITSMLDAVIRVGGRNLGMLCFEHVDQEHQWQEDEVTFACQLADQIALAVSNREREEAEETLRWNEALLQQMSSTLPFGLFIVDNRTDDILFFNQRFIEIWNLQPLQDRMARGELKNNEIIPDCIPLIADVPAFARSCEPLQDEENRSVVGDEIAFTDGRIIRRYSTQIRDAADRYFGRFYLFEDITASRQAISALSESEEKLRATFAQSMDGIMMTDPDFGITEWNDAMTAIYGFTRDEILGKPLWEISWSVLPEDQRSPAMLTIMEQRMQKFKHHDGPAGMQSLYEFDIQAKDGQRKTVQMSTFPIQLPDRIIYGSISRDLTGWKQTVHALRENEEKYRNLSSLFRLMADTMPDMLWAKDLNREYIFANKAICEMLLNAADTEEPLGKTDMFFATREREAHPDNPRWHTFGELCRDSDTITLQEQKPMQFDEFGNVRGKFLFLDVHKAPLYDDTGHLIGVVGSARDITARKQAEDESRQHEKTLEILNHVITAANRAGDLPSLLDTGLEETLALLEYDAGGIYLIDHASGTATVVASRNLPDWFLEQVGNVPVRQAPYDTLLVKGLPIITEHYEEVSPDRAKQSGFLSLAGIPLVSGDRIIGALNVVSTQRDVVTEDERETLISIGRELGTTIGRFTAEEVARKTAANLEILFNSIDEMVFILAMDGTILKVNETVEKRLGYTEEELSGNTVLFLHIPERRDEALQIVQGMITGVVDSCLVPLLAKDGTRIEVETRVTRGWWDNRDVLIGVSRDITARKRAEEALRESEELFRKLVATVPDIVVRTDLDGRITYANEKVLELVNFADEQDITGTYVFGFIAPESLPQAIGNTRLMFERQLGPIEYTFLTRDGARHLLEINGDVLRHPDGTPYGMVYVGRDITQRKKTEEALREANKKLNLLSSITRHDILNQLMVIQGYIALLGEGRLDPTIAEKYRKVTTAVERVSAMIRFTNEYENIGVNAPVWQDFRALVEKAVKEAQLGLVQVRNDLPAGTIVFADPLIGKVFYNLVENAVRHGGKITTIRFFWEEAGGSHIIACEDDGPGIPADEKERIFERGFGKNTGYGLFLAREILGITGITIRETGEPGKGARFEIHVPEGGYRFQDIQA